MRDTKNPWFVQRRTSADGNNNARFLCSLPPGGEHLTGMLRSKTFIMPEQLTFYVAGHDGPPSNKPQDKNFVRLRATDSNEVLIQQAPPRNDTAQKVTWNLSAHKGKTAYVEIVDGDTGSGYAWLAVGRFEPPVIKIPRTDLNEVARWQQAGADLARTLGLDELEPEVERLLRQSDPETQAAAGRAIASFHSSEDLTALASLLAEPTVPGSMRARIAETLPQSRDSAAVRSTLTEVMRTSARRVQVKLAQALAGGPKGSETLLAMVNDRIAPAAVLQERGVKDKLVAASDSVKARIEELTRNLTPPNEAIQKLIDDRRKTYDGTKARLTEGAVLFTKNCAACHQLDGLGGLIGPQLDGIGNRGLERLTEDLLDPNRAVDHAFRSTVVVLQDGDVVSGLLRREEGETLILADSTGKEISISKKQITDRRETETSLMPENFGELLTIEEFNDLMAFLLSKNSSPAKTSQNQ
jgi:putative heme-binding domain-containing protein